MMPSFPAQQKQIKRHRDVLSPKPILDRAALQAALKSNGIALKNGQIDLFYQLLHRSNYPPLDQFISDLLHGDESSVSACGSVSSNTRKNVITHNKVRTRNPISSRPGKRPQLPKAFLEFLYSAANCDAKNCGESFTTLTSKVQLHQTSADGSTTKIAVELQDGHVVESVLMRHEGSRATLCVSSQVGCAMGCTFCATGTMGIRGNLSSGEILEQLVHASRLLAASHEIPPVFSSPAVDSKVGNKENCSSSQNFHESNERSYSEMSQSLTIQKKKQKRLDLVRNVVFMGMGEPLNNYKNVVAACRAMIDRRLWNLSHNRVTVSTVGVTTRMRDLTRDLPEVNLALSLHAPNQIMREKIVPSAKGTPIETLIEALDAHMMAFTKRKVSDTNVESDKDGKVTGIEGFGLEERRVASKKKRAMIEYVMLEGDTSTIEAAHQLGKLCEGRHLVVNLIPYNKTDVRDKLSCPTEERMQEFRDIVSSYGSFCTIRRTMGADIAGACGQLVVEQEKKHSKVSDIEDGPFQNNEAVNTTLTTLAKRPKNNSKGRVVENDDKVYFDEENVDFDLRVKDPLILRLKVASAVAASCFVLSVVLFVSRRLKR